MNNDLLKMTLFYGEIMINTDIAVHLIKGLYKENVTVYLKT